MGRIWQIITDYMLTQPKEDCFNTLNWVLCMLAASCSKDFPILKIYISLYILQLLWTIMRIPSLWLELKLFLYKNVHIPTNPMYLQNVFCMLWMSLRCLKDGFCMLWTSLWVNLLKISWRLSIELALHNLWI